MAVIVLVVGNSASLTAGDSAIQSRLESNGHTVTLRSDDDAELTTGFDGVTVSDSCAAATIGAKYATSTRPGLTLEQPAWDLGTYSATASVTQWVVSEAGELDANLTGTQSVYSSSQSQGGIDQSSLGAGAQIVATRAGASTVCTYVAYDTGVAMASGTAPARRVAFRVADGAVPALTTAGQALLDAAIAWAFGAPTQTVIPTAVAAPAAPGAPSLTQAGVIGLAAPLAAPAAPAAPTVVPGTVTVTPTALAAPAAPGGPAMTMTVAPTALAAPAAPAAPSLFRAARPPLRVDFWALDDDGSILCPLPHPVSWDLSLIPGEVGSVQIEYPVDGLNYDILNARVNRDRDLYIHIRTDGTLLNTLGAILQSRDGDQVSEAGTVTFTGSFLTQRLEEARLRYNPADDKGETIFSAANAGDIMNYVLDAAQARGTLHDLWWSFTGAVDSRGTPWPANTDVSCRFPARKTLLELAQQLRDWGMCEFEVTTDLEVRLYVPETVGNDHTLADPPIVLRRGRDLLESPRRTDVRSSITDLEVTGADGVSVTLHDASARARRGRQIEGAVSEGNLTDTGSATAYGQVELARTVFGVDELTHTLTFDQNHPTPLRELFPADWVYTDTGDGSGVGARERIVQLTVSQQRREDRYSGGVVLRDLIADREVSLQRQIDRFSAGSAIVGTSEPPADDAGIPAAPVGVVVDSDAYTVGVDTYATLIVGWTEVTLNTDGSAATDIAGYRVEWRPTADPTNGWRFGTDTTSPPTSFGGVDSGVNVLVRVAAYDRDGNTSAWSEEVVILTEVDDTPPPAPSTPTAVPYLGQIKVGYDGLGSFGEAMPADTDRIELEKSLAAAFTTFEVVDTLSPNIPGERVLTDLAYGVTVYVRLVAVDRQGNRSAYSPSASATPSKIVNIDLGPEAVERAAIKLLAVDSAQMNLLAVNDAQFGSGSVGKLTAGILNVAVTNAGIIRSGTTGQRYELDAAALRFYNTAGTQTVQLNGALNWILGELRTGLSGTRLVANPGGVNPDRIDFFPSSGSFKAMLQTRTFSGQALIELIGGTNRGDSAAGQAGAHPLEGYVRWGLPESEFPYSFVSARQTNLDIEAPHLQIAISERYPGPNSPRRMEFIRKNSTGGLIAESHLRLLWNFDDYPWLAGVGANCGIVFQGTARVGVVNNLGNPASIEAADFVELSSITEKDQVQDARALLDPLRVIAAARARTYKLSRDRWYKPPATEEDPDPEPVEVPEEEVPLRVGVIAEELPELLQEKITLNDGTRTIGTSLGKQVNTLWGAFGQIQDQEIRSVAGRAELPAGPPRLSGQELDLPVLWDEEPLVVPTGGVVTVQSAVAWLGRVTARIVPGSLTGQGCIVRVRVLNTVSPSAANPILVEAQALYLWTPPYDPLEQS